MLELAGRLTTGTTVGSCGPRTIASHVAPIITAAAAAAGGPAPRIMALVSVSVTDDPAGAHAEAAERGRVYAELPSYRRARDREGAHSPADLLLAGPIDRIVEGLATYVEAEAELRIVFDTSDERVRNATRDPFAELLTG